MALDPESKRPYGRWYEMTDSFAHGNYTRMMMLYEMGIAEKEKEKLMAPYKLLVDYQTEFIEGRRKYLYQDSQ